MSGKKVLSGRRTAQKPLNTTAKSYSQRPQTSNRKTVTGPIQFKSTPALVTKTSSSTSNVPKAELDNSSFEFVFSTHVRYKPETIRIVFSQSCSEVPPKDVKNIFIQKCNECCKICNFLNQKADANAISTKTQLLTHINAAFSSSNLSHQLNSEAAKAFYNMVSANLFRKFPRVPNDAIVALDSAWPHLHLIYQALIGSLNFPLMIDFPPLFFQSIFENLLSPDDRERSICKSYLEQCYCKLSNQRNYFRTTLISFFNDQKCSSELLEIFSQTLGVVPSPLRNVDIDFFKHILLPLHFHPDSYRFSSILVFNILLYLSKSENLISDTIDFYFTHWPCSSCHKQIKFLKNIEQILSKFPSQVCSKNFLVHIKFVASVVESPSTDLSLVAISFLQNDNLQSFLKENSLSIFYPIVFHTHRASQTHWSEEVRTSCQRLLSFLEGMNSNHYKKAFEGIKTMQTREKAKTNIAKSNWTKVYQMSLVNTNSPPQIDLESFGI